MKLVNINEKQFEEAVLNQDGVVFVRFFGGWCGPCKMQSQILEGLEESFSDVAIFNLDIDKSQNLSHKYGVMTVPTLIVFKDGAELEKIAGFRNKSQLIEIFNNYINLEK